MEQLITPDELAEKLKIKIAQIYRLVRKNDIPYYKVGRLLRFKESEIKDWLKKK